MATADSNPDFFVGKPILSAYEPYPAITGQQYSSVAPASAAVVRWVQPSPIYVKNLVLQNSLGAGVPGATSQASTGSEGFSYALSAFVYRRQDYAANSSNLTHVGSASFGYSASLGYSSTSQQFGMSWLTDSTGGTANVTITSSDANWSNYANGARVFSLPFGTTLPAGEYWACFQHSSTTATSNSNVTLVSMSQLQYPSQQPNASAGYMGQTTTANSVYGANQNVGLLTTTPITSTTMAITAISFPLARPIWFAMSNA